MCLTFQEEIVEANNFQCMLFYNFNLISGSLPMHCMVVLYLRTLRVARQPIVRLLCGETSFSSHRAKEEPWS